MSVRLLFGLLQSAVLLLVAIAAHAEPTAKDIKVMSKTLGFVHLPGGSTKLAIVYDPANVASQKSANDLQALMGGSFKAGATDLAVVLVPLADLSKQNDVGVFYAVDGLGASAHAVADAAKAAHAPCLTDDMDLVRDGTCAIGVKADPKLQILVNKKVTDSDGLTFDPAFTMLITEI